jgi:hypothetical protein
MSTTVKVTKLSHVTLTPAMLFGERSAIAPDGLVYALGTSHVRIDGKDYAADGKEMSPDLGISKPSIAQKACALFLEVAQQIADESETVVEYTVAGEVRSVAPRAK